MSAQKTSSLHCNELHQKLVDSFQKMAKIWGLDLYKDDFKMRWNLVVVTMFLLSYLLSVAFIVVTNLDNSERVLKAISFVAVVFQLLVKIATIVNYTSELKALHRHILDITEHNRDQWELSLFTWIQRFENLAKVMFVLYMSSAVLFFVYPIYGFIVWHEKLMIVDFVLPYADEDTTHGYIAMLIAQIWLVVVTVMILFLVDTLFLLCVFYAAAYVELVEHDCRVLSQLISETENMFKQVSLEVRGQFHAILIKAIQRNQEMDDYINKIKLIFENGCLVQIGCCSYSMMLSLVVIKVTDWFVIYLFAASCVFQHALFCTSGTLIDSKTENLATAIYDIPWYQLSVQDQKMLILFLKHSQNNKKFYLMGDIPLNVATGLQILKTIYSTYIMIENVY